MLNLVIYITVFGPFLSVIFQLLPLKFPFSNDFVSLALKNLVWDYQGQQGIVSNCTKLLLSSSKTVEKIYV